MDTLRDFFKEKELLTLTGIYLFEICKFVKNNENYLFENKSCRHNILRSKQKNNVLIKQANNKIYHRSTFHTGIKAYNDLPLCIKALEGNKFEKTLKKWLIENCFYTLEEFYVFTKDPIR